MLEVMNNFGVYTCFVHLTKAYDRAPRNNLWAILLEFDVREQLLAAIKLLYKQSKGCVCVNGIKIKPSVSVDYDRAVFFLLSSSLYT